MKNNLRLFTGAVLAIFLTLLNWKSTYSFTCFSLIFPCIVLVVISSSFIDMKMHERRCFRNCFLQSSSFFSHLLTNRFWVTCIHLILSLLMTISIMYSVIDYNFLTWAFIFLHTGVIHFLFKKLHGLFAATFHETFILLFSREWAINISSILLFLVYCGILLNDYEPSYVSTDLRQTLTNASNQLSSSCQIIDQIMRLKIELDGWFWWMTNSATDRISNPALRTGIWVSFLGINGLAILGLNRFMAQIIYLLHSVMAEKHETN